MLNYQSSVSENIKNLYSSIKINDLESFKKIISWNKNFLTIRNNKQNNLLFYCLDKKNIEVFDFVQKKKPDFLLEKNINGLNCFTSLINKNAFKNIEYFLNNTTEKNKENLFISFDSDNNNLLMQMITKGNSFYQTYKIHFDKYDKIQSYSHTNIEGQTIPHLIALHDASYASEVLDMPQFKKLGQKNNKGATPFLLAARYSSFELFKKIAKNSDVHEKTDLLSNAIHFASYQGSVEKLQYLLENGLNPNEKNLYQNTPLSISLVEKKFDFSLELLKFVNNVEFKDILYMVRASEKNSSMFSYLIKNKKLILNALKDEEKTNKFLSHVFYYASESLIKENQSFFEPLISNDSNLLNSLFFSSIAGRRDFLFKVNYLIKNYGWFSLESKIFTNFNKEYPSGFVYALNQLPKNQLEYLVNNSYLLKNIKDKDLIVFKIICVNKNSRIFNKITKPYDFSLIKDDKSILDLINKISAEKIIDNLGFFEEMFINKEITDFVTDKVAQHIFDNETPIKQFKYIFTQIKNIKLKREIYIKLNEILLSSNQPNDLELIFKNKYTIMENILNNILLESPKKFQNFKYLINSSAINLKSSSAWSYLRSSGFDKKSFFVVSKAPDFVNYIKNMKLSEESYISSDFLKLSMQISRKSDRTALLINFLEYSAKHDNILPNTYNYFLTTFTEKEQRHIIKNAFHNYLKIGGSDLASYKFLERKYLNHYTADILNKNILDSGNTEHIHQRLNTDRSYLNVFNSHFSKDFNFIDITNLGVFRKKIDEFKNKMNNFSENCINDFMSSKINDIHLMGLSYIVFESKNLESYSLCSRVVDKLETFLIKKSPVAEFFQQMLDFLLFHENPDVKILILRNEKLSKSEYLTDKQKKYIFTQILENKLYDKKETNKIVKI